MAPVTVSNSYVGNNPDYAVKVTDVNSVVQPGNVQHVIVDSGAGGDTQYTEGAVAATPTGTVVMWKDAGNVINPISAATPLPVSATFSGTVTSSGVIVDGVDANIKATVRDYSNANPITVSLTDTSGDAISTLPVSAASLPLPTGAATSAKQDSEIALLTTIDADTSNISTKIDTLAGAVSGTEVQVDVLTMPTVTVQATDLDIRDLSSATDSVTVTGTVTANLGTIAGVATEATLSTLNGKVTACNTGAVTISAALPAGNNNIGDVDIASMPAVSTKTALTGSSPTAATVGVASAEAVPANANRKGLILTNTSDNTISLAFAAAAVLNSGITLYPGGTFNMNEYCFTTAQIRAIASAASSNLAIQEFV